MPTVFAIDQYRNYREVLERSMTIVDGVQVNVVTFIVLYAILILTLL